jgi:hypothetical protein
MKVETYDNQITMLGTLKNQLLLSSLGQIFVVKSFKVVEEQEKRLFGGTKTVKYFTSLVINTYHPQGKFLGVLREDACESMLHRYDFYVMRDQWVEFKEQLKSFGFEIVKIKEEPSNFAELGAKTFNER